MLTCGLEADAYLSTQAMKSHPDQVGGCVLSSVVKRAGWGWTPPLSLALLDAGRHPLQTGVGGGGGGCSWSSNGGQPLAPCAKQEGWSWTCPRIPPKVTGRRGPHLHRRGVSRGQRVQKSCSGQFPPSRDVPGGEAALHSLPRPFTHSHTEPWRLRAESVSRWPRPPCSFTEGTETGGVELRPGQGLLAPGPASISCLGWSWRNCSRVPALELNTSSQAHPTTACGGLHHTHLATPFFY